MTPLTREWVDKAECDFKVAGHQRTDSAPVYDAICFHAQQAVEKYLNAWLTEHGTDFARIHDLETLGNLCVPLVPELTVLLPDLRLLTSFAVEIRYPGTVAQPIDAERCWHAADRIRQLVRVKLGI